MRKEIDVMLDDGGESLHFRIKQMSATQAERWTFKMMMLIGAAGGSTKGDDLSSILATLSNAPYERIQELLTDLLSCCSIIKENVAVQLTEENVDGFISNRNTLIKLRAEAFKVNDFFQTGGLPDFGQSPAQVDIKRRA